MNIGRRKAKKTKLKERRREGLLCSIRLHRESVFILKLFLPLLTLGFLYVAAYIKESDTPYLFRVRYAASGMMEVLFFSLCLLFIFVLLIEKNHPDRG